MMQLSVSDQLTVGSTLILYCYCSRKPCCKDLVPADGHVSQLVSVLFKRSRFLELRVVRMRFPHN